MAQEQPAFDLVKEISKSLPSPNNRNILWDVVCSIFEPGVNFGLMVAIHFTFLSLSLVHIWLLYLTEGKIIHIWLLLVINLLLYPSLLIFISLAYKRPQPPPLETSLKHEKTQ